MLSEQEERVWNDVQRFRTVTTEEPAGLPRAASPRAGARRDRHEAPLWAVVGVWATVFLVLFGAVVAGLALGAAGLLGWGLWRLRPRLTGAGVVPPGG